MGFKALLKARLLNGWPLFWLVAIPMSLAILAEMVTVDMQTGEGVSHMIGYSVRWAVPFIYLAIAASSIPVLFPGRFAMWWMRNRKFIGLCFAVGMAWQGAYIFIVSTFFRDYYFSEIYAFRDELEGTIGYIFLGTMVLTSFHFGRKLVSPAQWKLIQKGGIYFLWAYPFSVYWWNLFYYPQQAGYAAPELHDYIFYVAGFAAFAVRIAAWGKRRYQAALKQGSTAETPPALKAAGGALIAAGVVAAATGNLWYDALYAVLYAPKASADMASWLPFWPLEPFIPLLVIGLGTLLFTYAPARQEQGVPAAN